MDGTDKDERQQTETYFAIFTNTLRYNNNESLRKAQTAVDIPPTSLQQSSLLQPKGSFGRISRLDA